MTEPWTITLPLVAGWINANNRTHWRAKAALTKAWRHMAFIEASNYGRAFSGQVHIVCTIHKTSNRLYDPNNLADTAKACIDGLVDAGTLRNDTYLEVVGPDMRAGEKRAAACVVITIEPVCSTCHQPMDSPPCCTSPESKQTHPQGFHTVSGGCAQGQP